MSRILANVVVASLLMIFLVPFAQAGAQSDPDLSGSVKVDGLSCPFCVHGLEKKLRSLRWIESVTVHIDDGRADFTVRDRHLPNVNELRAKVRDGGFTPRDTTLTARGRIQRTDSDVWLVISERVRLGLDASQKRDQLLRDLGSSGSRVAVSGTAQTTGSRTHVAIRHYHILRGESARQ